MTQRFEYTVIPAPGRGEKVRGARTGAERFSYALLTEMNRMAAQGWEYVRAETLPCEERSGLTSRTTVYHNLLVFRREMGGVARPLAAPDSTADSLRAPAARAAAPAVAAQSPAVARSPDARSAVPAAAPVVTTAAARSGPAPAAAPAAATITASVAAAPLAGDDPATDWPDGAEGDELAAAQARSAEVDNYDEPGFDPETRADTPADRPADPPPFIQRPPLAARLPAAGAAAGPAAADGTHPPHRLGPAER